MGYEVGGAWGAAMSREGRGEVVSMCGNGSYLMLSPDVYSSVLSGHKMIMVLCDSGGYAVIQRLQEFHGGAPVDNRYEQGTRRATDFEVDYVAHAASMGAIAEQVDDLTSLAEAPERACPNARTTVIVIRADHSPGPEATRVGTWACRRCRRRRQSGSPGPLTTPSASTSVGT